MNKRLYLAILAIIICASLTIALTSVFFGVFPFTFDQARDLIWVKNQVDFRQPCLIGPWGSLAGVYFGPLWFWLLAIPYILFSGNPIGVTLFNALLVFGSIAIAGFVLRKKNPQVAYFLVLLGFLSPAIQGIARYAFAQHLLPLLTFLLIYFYSQILIGSSKKYFFLSWLVISLLFHAEPPISIFSIPSLLIIMYLSPKKRQLWKGKSLILSLVFLIIPFLPQIIFEVRHDFIQLKSLLGYFTGANQSLGDILPFWQRLVDRPTAFFNIYRFSILQNSAWLALIILALVFYINFKQNQNQWLRKLWQASLIYVGSLLVLFIIYPPQLKDFYLDGLIMIFLLWTAMALVNLWQNTNLRKFIIIYLLLVFFINLKPVDFINSVNLGFFGKCKSGSVFANQKAVVDWIYQDAKGAGFSVYTYVSPVYDYPYQYLFLWHGISEYGYLPEEFSYLPDQPEYVQKKSLQLERAKEKIKKGGGNVYLIIEEEGYPERIEKWLVNFAEDEYQIIDKKEFLGNIRVEKRKKLLN